MDCYSVESEADTLDFLSPPVKRIHTAYRKDVPLELVNLKNKHLKGFHKKHTSGVPPPVRTGVESSTSLILKRTLQTQFLRQYSVRNYTSTGEPKPKSPPQTTPRIARHKPLIKVTVIPKTDQIHNPKLYGKRRHIPKKVQSTSSNQENSIQTKNVYLVVAGRRKDKIYEIRTTGSAELSNDQISQNEETPINDLLNFKQLVQSLNMDKKRKKEKRKNNPQTSFNEIDYSTECRCTNTSVRDEMIPNKSRVRIYGQLGLTQDDRYVLKYGASVDDKPVMSDVAQLMSDFTAFPTAGNDEDTHTSENSIICLADRNITPGIFRNQRDSCVQADFNKDCDIQKPKTMDFERKKPSKGSQGTQVNFNIQIASTNKPKIAKPPQCVDKKVQCYCCAADEASEDYDDDTVNKCKSPLIIISVYPKHNLSEAGKSVKTTIENKRSVSPTKANVYNRNIDRITEKSTVELNKREIKRAPMSRSPSPAKKLSKTRLQDNKLMETRIIRTCRDRKSPECTSAMKNIKENIQEKEKKIEATCLKTFKLKTPSATKPQVSNTKPQVLKNQQNAKKTKLQSREMGCNTEHLRTKKALVDSYTKQLSSHMAKINKPRIDTSKVTINIDGDREYYDVLFNQDKGTTDLTVRKKPKDSGSQRSDDEESSASLENLFLLPDTRPRTRSLSLALYDNQSQCGAPLTKHVSRLTIRDSLEISHRREVSHGMKTTQTCVMVERNESTKDDTEFLAPVKHYTGDDCSIYDPVARDKEIRQLLGLNKSRPTTSRTQQDHISEKNNASPYHCFYQKNDKKFVTGISLCPKTEMRTNAVQCDKIHNTKAGTNTYDKDDNNKESTVEKSSLQQELVTNKNIQVYLQVEQFAKKKPIKLTTKQYKKVRRTIQKNISKNVRHQKNKCLGPNSQVSVGEIKKKTKLDMNASFNKEVQTEVCDELKGVEQRIQEILDHKVRPKKQKLSKDKKTSKRDKPKGRRVTKEICNNESKEIDGVAARRTMSSVEVHYANVFYKHVTFSSKGKVLSTTSLGERKSFLTIFRGHRKSPTPNLGTSAYSLYSEERSDTKSIKVLMEPRDLKRRKPFLSRLVSYLVMRSVKGSKQTLNVHPATYPPTVNSSVDSYHISSSLAGADVTSSIYDTTASFYSNHTIFPVNSKMKRGFFSSVRGFLSNRKS